MTAAVIRAAVLAVVSTLCCLLLRRGSPELGLVLAMVTCAGAVMLCSTMLGEAVSTAKKAAELTGLSPVIFAPVVKCTGIGMLSKIAADLCRDGGESASAGAVELAGACGALYCALPLIGMLMDCVGDLL